MRRDVRAGVPVTPVVEGGLLAATVGCVVANVFEVVAKITRARFVMRNSAEVGISAKWIPGLALIEGAGVAGILLGLIGFPRLGLAAAGGLVAFFLCAVAVHLHARVLHNIAFPGVFLLLAAAAAGHFLVVLG